MLVNGSFTWGFTNIAEFRVSRAASYPLLDILDDYCLSNVVNRKGRFVADVVEIVISKIQVCRQDCLSELSVRYSIIGLVFSAVTLVALSEYELLTSFLQMVDMLNQMLPINLNPAHFVGSSFFSRSAQPRLASANWKNAWHSTRNNFKEIFDIHYIPKHELGMARVDGVGFHPMWSF